MRLERLTFSKLLARVIAPPVSFRCQPGTPERAAALDGLALAYKERRVTVIESIFTKPPSPIQGFADAFRIRKEQKNG